MCGITGICVPKGGPAPDRDALAAATRALAHRGPDAEGFYFADGAAFGHRRLSIIDVAGGDQPIYNEDRTVAVVFNGEIYNYVELKAPLEQAGHRFLTHSDTEVIVHSYEQHGDRCLDAFNGMFAIALWDTGRRRLLLARDRLGEKPLFYHERNGVLCFASELKALLRFPQVGKTLSPAALDAYLAYGYVPGEASIVEGVRKLPPGHRLTWQDGVVRVEPYWDVAFGDEAPPDEEAWLSELEARLRESVRIRLRSDVPLGVFLSGGIDSSAVVALAAQETPGRLKTYSIGFEDADFDELSFARTVAERFGTEHHELVVRDDDISVLPRLAYHLDEPLADPSALPTYYVCREARRHVTVCLSGDGGDEVFGGYERYRQGLRYEGYDRWAGPSGLRAACRALGRGLPRWVRGRGALQRLGAAGARRYFHQTGKLHPEERLGLYQPDMLPALRENPWLFEPYFSEKSLLSSLQHTDQKAYLPDDILVKVDRMAMQNSLEVRVPFLDHTLLDFVNRTSARLKLRDGVTKLPLRRLLARHVPASVSGRGKRGFGIPMRRWFRGQLSGYLQELLAAPGARCHQWLRPEAIGSLLRDEARGQRDLSRKLWTLLMLEHWCRAYEL